MDLEAVEGAVRLAVLAAGAKVVEELLRPVGVGRREEAVRCRCGACMSSKGLRGIWVLCLVGWVWFERSLYVCPRCGQTRYPGDEELDIVNTSRSPGVRRQVVRLGAKESFQEASEDLRELAGILLCRKEAERITEAEGGKMEAWMAGERLRLRFLQPPMDTPKTIDTLYIELDGTGIPVVPGETEGRKGKRPDGTAKTREAKVGCVFTQTSFDNKGRPIRDPRSTSFIGAIESCGPFGYRLYAEAVRRGLFEAKQVIVLGDGAEWIRNIAQTHFGTALFIIDYYHAAEHIGQLCRDLFASNPTLQASQRERWTGHLWEGEIDAIIEQATALLPKDPHAKTDARKDLAYFVNNKEHMKYGEHRKAGRFIGSGVVEAACKHLVGSRCKQSGMEWTVQGANDVLAARSVILSNRFEEYWENRAV